MLVKHLQPHTSPEEDAAGHVAEDSGKVACLMIEAKATRQFTRRYSGPRLTICRGVAATAANHPP